MISLENDVSLSTLVVSGVIAAVGFILKATGKLLVTAVTELIKKLVETIGRVDTLDANLARVVGAVAAVEKNRADLNEYYKRLKVLEGDVEQLKQ